MLTSAVGNTHGPGDMATHSTDIVCVLLCTRLMELPGTQVKAKTKTSKDMVPELWGSQPIGRDNMNQSIDTSAITRATKSGKGIVGVEEGGAGCGVGEGGSADLPREAMLERPCEPKEEVE